MRSTTVQAPGRRRHSPEEISRILSEYNQGGITQRELARRHGVCAGTIQYWLRRRARTETPSQAAWVELVPEPTRAASAYRVELPGGVALVLGAGWQPGEVRALVQALCQP